MRDTRWWWQGTWAVSFEDDKRGGEHAALGTCHSQVLCPPPGRAQGLSAAVGNKAKQTRAGAHHPHGLLLSPPEERPARGCRTPGSFRFLVTSTKTKAEAPITSPQRDKAVPALGAATPSTKPAPSKPSHEAKTQGGHKALAEHQG